MLFSKINSFNLIEIFGRERLSSNGFMESAPEHRRPGYITDALPSSQPSPELAVVAAIHRGGGFRPRGGNRDREREQRKPIESSHLTWGTVWPKTCDYYAAVALQGGVMSSVAFLRRTQSC